jgi:hypothetical protein
MAADSPPETPISRALKRRKELQDIINASMSELEKLEEFLRMYRQLSASDEEGDKGDSERGNSKRILGRAGYGKTQSVFELMARAIILEAGRPLSSSDIVEEFRKRGQPLGGNETRTAWNRLWQAKDRGVLLHMPRYGYWVTDEPLPETAMASPPPRRKNRPKGEGIRHTWAGKPRGRSHLLTEAQWKIAENWKLEGKTNAEIARDLGGIAVSTVAGHFKGGLKALQAKRTQETPEKLDVQVDARSALFRHHPHVLHMIISGDSVKVVVDAEGIRDSRTLAELEQLVKTYLPGRVVEFVEEG